MNKNQYLNHVSQAASMVINNAGKEKSDLLSHTFRIYENPKWIMRTHTYLYIRRA